MDLKWNARLNCNTIGNEMESKGSEWLMQVVADLAVAEGREGEYKAGIYQFPIDYTKVVLLSHI